MYSLNVSKIYSLDPPLLISGSPSGRISSHLHLTWEEYAETSKFPIYFTLIGA